MPAAFPNPGDRIGRFRVVSQLGAGGMGVVYSAVEENLDRLVALKVISPLFADDASFRERFSREARALASLDSPNVVQVYAHGEDDGYLYIATQLIPDGDLGQMLAKWGQAPVGKAAELIEQVAAGLADAHDAGLVHRDIKPANVLVRRRSTSVSAYLGDFGIARRVDAEATRVGTAVVGTPSYMAPELHGGASASKASDVYSLGCVLWVTLTGSAPYGGTTAFEVVGGHVNKPVPQLSGRTPLVEVMNRVLRRSMAKDPGDRYASAAELRNDLRAAARLTGDPEYMAIATPVGEDTPTAARAASTPFGPPPSQPPHHTPTPSGPVVVPVQPSMPPPSARPSPMPVPMPTPMPGAAYNTPTPTPTMPSGPPARRPRTALWVAAAVAAVLAVAGGVGAGLAAGGGGGSKGDNPSSKGVVDDAFAKQEPSEIIRTAQRTMRTLKSVHLEGNIVQDSRDLRFSMTVTSGGDCDGFIGVGDGTADLRSVDGKTWFKPDRAFWTEVSEGADPQTVDVLVAFQGGKWVDIEDDDAEDFTELCDIGKLLEGDSSNSSPVTDGTDTFDGKDVVKVTTEESDGPVTSYVDLTDPHYVLRLDAGDMGAFDFSDFGAATDFLAPTDEQTVNLTDIGG